MSQDQYLFVYGTLKREFGNRRAAVLLHKSAVFIAEAKVPGRLFDFGNYPGAVLENSGDRWISGEVFQLIDPERTFYSLDKYEGAGYDRVWVSVNVANGLIDCWIYVYNGPTNDLRMIKNGTFTLRE
ncbi:MAG: gamma-glutamylcyclotransferase family protein [Cyclobacteriaceae bacterium]